ncbi:hypothetical protein [Corynebacterium cystitidis]|uniref:hypothetical protein n=1 Tax=Corynebacterium cystitidis TaxID=35757 RepID=UPI00211F41A3|nr:hypothetical protein [Corynebacterium cystitidis]
MLVENRGSTATLVVFHASLSKRAQTVPALQGQDLARSTGVNLVAVADPTVALGDIDLAWFLGNRRIGKLPPLLGPIIKHVTQCIGGERIIVFGPSGGGYAAINFGRYFRDQIVLAVNPRLNMSAKPLADITTYLNVGHRVKGRTPRKRIKQEYVTEKASAFYPDGLPFDLCIFQNTGDSVFYENQYKPFVSEMDGENRLFTRLQNTGPGHQPIPPALLREIISAIASTENQQEAIFRAGFSRPD